MIDDRRRRPRSRALVIPGVSADSFSTAQTVGTDLISDVPWRALADRIRRYLNEAVR